MSDAETLLHILYTSSSDGLMREPDVAAILEQSRRNNAAVGITGLLVYCDGSFIQALEGPADVVEATMQRIEADPRHRDVTRIVTYETSARDFPDWTMAYASPDRTEMQARLDLLRDRKALRQRADEGGVIGRLIGSFLDRTR